VSYGCPVETRFIVIYRFDSINVGLDTKVERRFEQYTVSSFGKSIIRNNKEIT